jgi:hypothetical protein
LLPPPPLAALGAGQPSSLRPAKVRPSGSRPPFARPHLASVSYPAFDDRKCFPGLSSHHPSVWGSDDERSSTPPPPPSNSPHPGYPGRHDLPVQRETVRGLFYFIFFAPKKTPSLRMGFRNLPLFYMRLTVECGGVLGEHFACSRSPTSGEVQPDFDPVKIT